MTLGRDIVTYLLNDHEYIKRLLVVRLCHLLKRTGKSDSSSTRLSTLLGVLWEVLLINVYTLQNVGPENYTLIDVSVFQWRM